MFARIEASYARILAPAANCAPVTRMEPHRFVEAHGNVLQRIGHGRCAIVELWRTVVGPPPVVLHRRRLILLNELGQPESWFVGPANALKIIDVGQQAGD